jgi:phasin family protein
MAAQRADQNPSKGAFTMARKSSPKSTRSTAKRAKRPARAPAAPKAAAGFKIPGANLGDLSKMAKVLTPEQAFDLYRANARMALDVIDAAIESTAKLRKHQFAGEEEARSMQKKALRHAAEATDPQTFMAAGQSVTQEAVEKAMRYWGEMFDMIVEMQKRLFALMEEQMAGMPGAKEAKAAMAMMPDLRQAQNLVKAMQGVMSSGGSTFESMQRVMGDFTRYVKP